MKITQFTIKNYKSFSKTNNRVYSANNINLIYGENNSGKSNILRFLKLIFSLKKIENNLEVEGENVMQTSRDYFFEGLIESEPYIYHKNIRHEKIEYTFFIELTHKEIKEANFDFFTSLESEYLKNSKNPAILRFDGEIKSLDNKYLSEIRLNQVKLSNKEVYLNDDNEEHIFRSGAEEMNLQGDFRSFKQFMAYLNNIVIYIDNDRFFGKEKYALQSNELTAKNFKNWLYNFSLDEFRYEEYLNLLSFIRKHKIQSLKSLSDLDLSFGMDSSNNLELLLSNGSERLPIDSFGTGVSQIFFILCKIYISKKKIILIEEIELNLSPKTQRELFKILREMIEEGIIDQVFFTSHSGYFNFRNDFSIYEVNINSNGVSEVERKDGNRRSPFFANKRID